LLKDSAFPPEPNLMLLMHHSLRKDALRCQHVRAGLGQGFAVQAEEGALIEGLPQARDLFVYIVHCFLLA